MDFLIADDHNVVISGLKGVLGQAFTESTFSLAHGSDEVFKLLEEKQDYDLALVDLKMPGMDSFEFLKKLCSEFKNIKVAVISGLDDPATIKKSLALGAVGFIPKSVSEETLISAIRLILRGDTYLPPHLLSVAAEDEAEKNILDLPIDLQNAFKVLTERQKEILLLLGEGRSNKDIARCLDLSENTIKVHVSGVLRALNLSNRTQAGVIGEKMRHLRSLQETAG